MIGEYRRVRFVYNGQLQNKIYSMDVNNDKASDSNPEGFENEKGQGNSPGEPCQHSVSN